MENKTIAEAIEILKDYHNKYGMDINCLVKSNKDKDKNNEKK